MMHDMEMLRPLLQLSVHHRLSITVETVKNSSHLHRDRHTHAIIDGHVLS